MSYRIRAARPDDVRALYDLAKLTGGGFTNLPAERQTLENKLARSEGVTFSPAYLLSLNRFAVPGGSPIRTQDEVDRAGVGGLAGHQAIAARCRWNNLDP